MCLRQISHYACGHEVTGEWRKCRPYLEKEKSGGGPSFFRSLFRRRPKCKNRADVDKDIPAACSAACTRRWEDTRRRQEKELKRREKERREKMERSGKSTSTTVTFTRSSWPSVVQQPSPSPPPARVEVQRTPPRLADPASPPQKPIRRKPIPTRVEAQHAPPRLAERPVPPQAPSMQRSRSTKVEAQHAPRKLADRPVLTQAPRMQQPRPTRAEVQHEPPRPADHPICAQASGAQKTSSTRVEAQRAPPKRADRPVLPQTNRAETRSRSRTPIIPTQANIGFQDRPTHCTSQSQSRLPVASNPKVSANSVSRSNGRHLRQDKAGTLDDPRARLRTAQQPSHGKSPAKHPDVQTVAAKKPVLVSSPAFTASPSSASVIQPSRVKTSATTPQSRIVLLQARKQTSQPSPTQSKPPVPPKDKPPVPPKDSWQPKHLDLIPAPLAVGPRAPGRTVRPLAPSPSSRSTGSSRTNPTTAPRRIPDSVSILPPRSQSAGDEQQAYPTAIGYRPNPMFANK